jgi:hypothetical protein
MLMTNIKCYNACSLKGEKTIFHLKSRYLNFEHKTCNYYSRVVIYGTLTGVANYVGKNGEGVPIPPAVD